MPILSGLQFLHCEKSLIAKVPIRSPSQEEKGSLSQEKDISPLGCLCSKVPLLHLKLLLLKPWSWPCCPCVFNSIGVSRAPYYNRVGFLPITLSHKKLATPASLPHFPPLPPKISPQILAIIFTPKNTLEDCPVPRPQHLVWGGSRLEKALTLEEQSPGPFWYSKKFLWNIFLSIGLTWKMALHILKMEWDLPLEVGIRCARTGD